MWWLLIPILTGLYTGISVMLNTSDYCSFGGDTVGRHGVLFVNVGVPPSEGMPCPQAGGLVVAGSLALGLAVLLYVAWRVGALETLVKRPATRSSPRSTAQPPSKRSPTQKQLIRDQAASVRETLETARSSFDVGRSNRVTDKDYRASSCRCGDVFARASGSRRRRTDNGNHVRFGGRAGGKSQDVLLPAAVL